MEYVLYAIDLVLTLGIAAFFLRKLWGTRSLDVFLGFCVFLAFSFAFSFSKLPVLSQLWGHLLGSLALLLTFLFPIEIRQLLASFSPRVLQAKPISDLDRFLDHLCKSVYHIADCGLGALICLENRDSLDPYSEKGILLDASFSPELLESVFHRNSPLHDGAVIMRGDTVVSAQSILPLAEDTSQLLPNMGTRHQAGLGLSQCTDALVIVVSEENHKVSVARKGIMTHGVKPDRLRGIVRSIFAQSYKPRRPFFRFGK